jgi:hypothetical protein
VTKSHVRRDSRARRDHCHKPIPALAEIVLVAHDRREVEVVRREVDGSWSRHIARATETVKLTSVGCELPVSEIYRNPLAF